MTVRVSDTTWLDATAQADLIRRGEVSPKELTEAAIARIEAVNPRLDAVIRTRFDAARQEADGDLPDGRTNVPELGTSVTTEPRSFPPACNPWDPGRSTGGSSGGAGAAVAAGMVAVAHANDMGGSTRAPASECGVVGRKATRARVSQGPMVGEAYGGAVHEGGGHADRTGRGRRARRDQRADGGRAVLRAVVAAAAGAGGRC